MNRIMSAKEYDDMAARYKSLQRETTFVLIAAVFVAGFLAGLAVGGIVWGTL